MANAKIFQKSLKRLAQAMSENVGDGIRRTALAVDSAVVIATPVDTGRARLNWQVAVNRIPKSILEPLSTGNENTAGQGPNLAAALSNARRALKRKLGHKDVVYIANNVPYIGELNRGKSRQAPALFVQQAVAVGRVAAKATRLLRKRRL